MIKVGDKIVIKKKERTLDETYDGIIEVLRSKMPEKDKLEWCDSALSVLEMMYEKDDVGTVQKAKKTLIPVLYNLVNEGSLEMMASFFDYYKRCYCFCARRDFECFVDYIEWEQPKKVLANRRNVLGAYVNALNELAFNPNLHYVVVSLPPSYGKSYLATLWCCFAFGLSIDNSIIRLSYSDELVLGFSRTVKNIISSPTFSDVFTFYKIYNTKPFEVERESDWKIKNAKVPKSNLISRTRSGATTGERANFAIILDDMTKGAEEANSDSIHRGIYDKWNTEWWNRRDGEKCKFLFVGTQWNSEDILNKIIEDRNKIEILKSTDNPYVMRSRDTIVIRVPLLDKDSRTTCSEVYPQEVAEQLRDNTDPFLFSCVYQQNPIPITGREFDWENLKTYVKLPEQVEKYCMASLDTARKGKDNVSMPILKPDGQGNYYFVDCIFAQKPMEDLYDDIVGKIITHKIIKFVIENNIDTSLKSLLKERLKARGVDWCEIIEKYNVVKKEERIKNNRGIVQKYIVFKDKSVMKANSDYGRFMENLTKYSFDKPNYHDDAPDSICMFASELIIEKLSFNKPIAVKRIF